MRITGVFKPLLLIDDNEVSIEDLYKNSKMIPIVSDKMW